MDQPGKVDPARGQLNRENEHFSVPVRACEFGLARRVWQSRPASACSFFTPKLNMVPITGFLPISDSASIYLLFIPPHIRHRASPESIGSPRNCVLMAFTVSCPQGSSSNGCCLSL